MVKRPLGWIVRVLTINCGSSSLKFRVFESGREGPDPTELARGEIASIGAESSAEFQVAPAQRIRFSRSTADHAEAVALVLDCLGQEQLLHNPPIEAIGHRVVHGGDRFRAAARIDEAVLEGIEAVSSLAPLHNRPALAAIRVTRARLGTAVPMVAVFDTAYFADLPEDAARYPIPRDLSLKHRIRRFGFHGLAHQSMARWFAATTGRSVDDSRLITFQLGAGCSVAAIERGRPIETSMGFTPLEGLMMGTRCGDLDPALPGYLSRVEGLPIAVIETWLNQRSGLLGVSGRSADLRQVLHAADAGDPDAALAIAMFCHRARKYLGAYLGVLEGADAIIFGGGIGENSPTIRARIGAGFGWCGLQLDEQLNAALHGRAGRISQSGSAIHAFVARVDEERAIFDETIRCLGQDLGTCSAGG